VVGSKKQGGYIWVYGSGSGWYSQNSFEDIAGSAEYIEIIALGWSNEEQCML
jgi:hypothetical protein